MISDRFGALLAALLLSVPFCSAYAGGGADSSGGGLGVVCFDSPAILEALRGGDGLLRDELLPHIRSIENFDLYEAGLTRGTDPRFKQELIPIHPGENARHYAQRILKRLDHSVPKLAELFASRPVELTVKEPLEKMNDAKQIGLIDYENCMLATMGLNRIEDDTGYLKIDARLYNHARQSEQSRGVFLLHEIIYVAARKLGHENSRHTRALVNLLITRNPELTVQVLIDKAREFGFSGEARFPSYGAEVVRPIIAELLKTAHTSYMKFQPEAVKLIAQLHNALAPYAVGCNGDHVTPCLNSLYRLKKPELKAIEDKTVAFVRRRTTAVLDAMNAMYATAPLGKARLASARGLPRGVSAALDRDLRENVINQIAIQLTDGGLELPGMVPLDVADLNALENRFVLEAEREPGADYLVGVVR